MMNKLNRTDQTILFIASTLLVIFSYFLYDDSLLFRKVISNQNEQIGRIYGLQNDVRRKSQGTFSWLPTTNLETVYHLDSVFTGSGSEASIQLFDGSLIHIRENSLITLNVVQGQLKLELKYGDLVGEIKQNSEIKIKSGTEEFQLKGDSQDSSVVITRDRIGKNEVQSIKGKTQVLSTKTGKKLAIKAVSPEKTIKLKQTASRQALVIPPPLPVEKKPEVTLEQLTQNGAVFAKKKMDDPVALDWKSKGTIAQFSFEIKKSEDDVNVLQQTLTKLERIVIDPSLIEGDYVWRVTALDSTNKPLAKTEFRKFKIMMLIAPYLTKPSLGESIPNEIAKVNIEWSSQISKQYEWQVASDIGFQTLIAEGKTEKLGAEITNPRKGSYWTRVRAQKTEVLWTPWSETGKFNVLPAKLAAIPAPIIIQKKIEVKPLPGQGRNPASIPETKINWKTVPIASSYIVEISDDPSFQKIKLVETKQLEFALASFDKNMQFVRVKAKTKGGAIGLPSETAEVKLTIEKPTLNKQDSIIEKAYSVGARPKGLEIPMSWSSVYSAGQYRLEVAQNPQFESAQVLELKSNEGLVKLNQPGKYFARVRPMNKTGQTLTDYSNVIEFEYSFKSSLPAPALSEPFNKSTLFLQKDIEPYVWLEWKNNPGVLKYQVQISSDPEFKKVIISTNSEKNRFLIKQKIPYGNIYWRVRAISEDSKQSSEWSESRMFSLTYKKNENFVE